MTTINFKRGQTFVAYCQRLDANGAAVNLTGVAITSSLGAAAFSASLTTAITDAANGKFTLSATATATKAWPVMALLMDVAFDDGTSVVISDTVTVNVSDNVTAVTSSSAGLPGQSGNPLVFQDAPNTSGNVGGGANVQTGSVLYQFAASYMGALAADPATRTDGSALQQGDIYWNTTLNEQRTWNGANWQVVYTPSPTTTGDINYTGTLTGGTGVINIGAGQFYKDVYGDVGLGTSTFAYAAAGRIAMEINGSSSSIVGFKVGGVVEGYLLANTSLMGLGAEAGGSLLFRVGAEAARFDSSGNFGIGTSSPAGFGNTGKLAVQAASSTDGIVATFANSGSTGAAIQFFQNGVATATIGMPAANGGIVFKPSGNTEMMRIDNAGRVGISVIPSSWGASYTALDIAGTASITDAAGIFRISNNTFNDGTNWIYKISGHSTKYDQDYLSGDHKWFTAASGT
ncbi:MAG: hypothetical protein PF443_05975, partial [Allgaiera sp.]|nr:hypothetical protein [Allgaiera sp.]